jgi:hypothetical protein
VLVPWRHRSTRSLIACTTTSGSSRWTDFDTSVKRIIAQPFLLTAQVEAIDRRHVPDFLLLSRWRHLVKPDLGQVSGGPGDVNSYQAEFRRQLPGDSLDSKRTIFKTVAALANGHGGSKVFGVESDKATACLSVGDRRYLYTTGYVPSLGRYPHGHVPTPVQITGHVGDSSAKALLAEVLLMTKMNWNSARFAEKLPVTVRFANEVGTILQDFPDDYAPEARYALYM